MQLTARSVVWSVFLAVTFAAVEGKTTSGAIQGFVFGLLCGASIARVTQLPFSRSLSASVLRWAIVFGAGGFLVGGGGDLLGRVLGTIAGAVAGTCVGAIAWKVGTGSTLPPKSMKGTT